jgi:sulfopyruvate decarboxylase TPP-binding subunit
MVFTGSTIASTMAELGVTHVIWLPDSALGPWEQALEAAGDFQLLRVCREGEAWPLAAGLMLGGACPLVMMQVTGLFESGDALRNVVFDLRLPVFSVLGARSWLVENTTDSARRFTEPILRAWGIDFVVLEHEHDRPKLVEHHRNCQSKRQAGAALIAEGSM